MYQYSCLNVTHGKQQLRWIYYSISSSIIFVWPFSVFLIRNFIPFTLLWHLRFTIEFLWEILFSWFHTRTIVRKNFGSVELKWIWRSSWQTIIVMLIFLFRYECICFYFYILFLIYLSSNLCLLSQKYVHNFAINLELVLHLSMSGRSNWIDALLHFCFVGHWAWQLFKKQFVYCFEISLAMPQTCST